MEFFGFSRLLETANVPLDKTRLVRHQDVRGTADRTPYRLWLKQDGSLERYQQIQGGEVFSLGQWLASFVVSPLGETIFVGIFRVDGLGRAPSGTLDPVGGHDVSGLFDYEISRTEDLADFAGRLVIDWGLGFRKWVQRADRQDKQIIELRKSSIDPPFPGFLNFVGSIRLLEAVPMSWRVALGAVSGVYILINKASGKIYVGSASGSGGFWARWENYAQTGHGGNEGMKLISKDDYQVSILEIASSSALTEEVIRLEAMWKRKLLSRHFGFNRN